MSTLYNSCISFARWWHHYPSRWFINRNMRNNFETGVSELAPICLERHIFRSHMLATVSHKQVPSALFGVRLCCSHDSPYTSPWAMDHKQKYRSQIGIRCLWNALQFAVMKLDRVGRFLCLVVCCLLVRWLEDDGSLFLAFFIWLLVLLDGCLKAKVNVWLVFLQKGNSCVQYHDDYQHWLW